MSLEQTTETTETDRPMKVLIFMTQFYQLSGAERLAAELAQELNMRGIHADILSMYTEDLPGVAEAKQGLLERGIPNVHFLGMKIHPSITSLMPSAWKLRCLLKEQEYDIIETSQVSPSVIASWATLAGHTRHVAGLHQVFKRRRENSNRHKFWRFSIWCNPHTRYYAISEYVKDAWLRYSGTAPERTKTIYNAIPDDCFEAVPDRRGIRTELEISQDSRIALYVGRLAKYKGCDSLLDALGPVLEQNDLYLLYVGALDPTVEGSEEMIQQMQEQILNEKWEGRVRFLGYRKDIPRIMASSDILTHPARIEGFGLTLVEAMAAGLLVAASNVEGIPEVLDGTNSLMVPADDPDSFRNAVLELLSLSDAEAALATAKGRARAGDFRIECRIDTMTRLFAGLIEEH